jgi:hypothetical protein
MSSGRGRLPNWDDQLLPFPLHDIDLSMIKVKTSVPEEVQKITE